MALDPAELALAHALAGTAAGAVSGLVLYPIDSVRSILQALPPGESSMTAMGLVLRMIRNRGLVGTWARLYRGVDTTLGTLVVSQAIYFYVYERMKGAMFGGKPSGPLQALFVAYCAGVVNATATSPLWTAAKRIQLAQPSREAPSGAASLASSTGSALVSPSPGPSKYREAYSRLMPVHRVASVAVRSAPLESGGMMGAISAIVREEGMAGLFRSLPVSIVLCINPAIQFFAYERIRRSIVAGSDRSLSAVEGFAAGALAKAIATVLTFPLQVVQTRMQAGVDNDDDDNDDVPGACASMRAKASGGNGEDGDGESADADAVPLAAPRTPAAMASSGGGDDAKASALPPLTPRLQRPRAVRSSSVLAALMSLLRQGGVAALFKGMGPKLLQTVLNAALMFALYERMLNSSKAVVRSIVGKAPAGKVSV